MLTNLQRGSKVTTKTTGHITLISRGQHCSLVCIITQSTNNVNLMDWQIAAPVKDECFKYLVCLY